MEQAEILLRMKNISKTFPGVKALDHVEFEVYRGEVMGLLGENGAGKSTLIKIITGYYHYDSGEACEMVFEGETISPQNTAEAQKLGIGTIFQELNLSPNLSIAENIYLGNAPKKRGLIDWKTMEKNAAQALSELGIEVDVRKKVETQSTAIQQMTSIARALAKNVKLLIMDEATSSLDQGETAVLFEVVRKLKARGISTIFITHKMDEVYQICDRGTIFKDGKYVTCRPMVDLPKIELVSLMIGNNAEKLINKRKIYQENSGEAIYQATGVRTANHRLNGIDIEIKKGEVVGLAGLLGSGRTELAKVIFGDDQNYRGETYLNHKAVKFREPKDAILKKMSYLPEDRKTEGIFPFMSVEDNLVLPGISKYSKFGLVNRRLAREATQEYIKRIGIKTPSGSTKIRNLSGGNQQKVILSRWLAMEPDLIILDEPTRGIDIGAKGEIEELVARIAAQGISILYISSEIDELVRECDRVVILREGRVISQLTGEMISRQGIMDAIARPEQEGGAYEG